MGLLARAEPAALAAAMAALGPEPAHVVLKGPQIGLLMGRGRIGGGGDAFNLGELTAARCVVRLTPDGPQGVAYALGRDRTHVRRAALCDALLQTPHADAVRATVLAPLSAAEAVRRAARAAKAAATRVEFFTLARGED